MMRALLVVGLLLVQTGAGVAEPVLLLNEPHDIFMAEHFCSWAEGELRDHDYLVKHFTCSKRESCKRALDINAVCEASGPEADVRQFHSRLLTQFASNPQCQVSIVHLTGLPEGKDVEAMRAATWELNLDFTPGAAKQSWALWPHRSGEIVAEAPMEGEGDARQIAIDVCNDVAGKSTKIGN